LGNPGRSRRPREAVWDSDDEYQNEPRPRAQQHHFNYYGGRDQSFKKPLEECTELNTNMQRAKIILGLDQKSGGGIDDPERSEQHRQTNNYRLYGLHYGKMAQATHARANPEASGRSLSQLHEQLCLEMQVQDRNQNDGGGAYPSSQIGRDFLAGKAFEVGDFEQDLRDVWNFQFEIEQKYLPNNTLHDPTS